NGSSFAHRDSGVGVHHGNRPQAARRSAELCRPAEATIVAAKNGSIFADRGASLSGKGDSVESSPCSTVWACPGHPVVSRLKNDSRGAGQDSLRRRNRYGQEFIAAVARVGRRIRLDPTTELRVRHGGPCGRKT